MAFLKNIAHTPGKAGYWATQSIAPDATVVEQPENTLGCTKCTCVWTRATPTGTREDVCTISFALAKVVGGGLFSQLLPADITSIEADVDNVFASLATKQDSDFALSEYVWFHHRADNPPTDKGNELVGPPVKRTSKAIVGTTASVRLPDQDSVTISLRTPSRKHWGRNYIPGVSQQQLDMTYGRVSSTFVDYLAAQWNTFNTAALAKSITMGVWTWKFQAFLTVQELRVDNVWDIQRRRRAKQQSYFKSYT